MSLSTYYIANFLFVGFCDKTKSTANILSSQLTGYGNRISDKIPNAVAFDNIYKNN